MYTLDAIKSAIEFAPVRIVSDNPDIVGWNYGNFTICAICADRLADRGCGYMLKGAFPIYSDSSESITCALEAMHM